MVQIYFDCDIARIEGVNCMMGAEMVFDRYAGKANSRSVFKESFTTARRNGGNSEAFNEQYDRIKFGIWREKIALYLGADPGARKDGGRFDLPPYQIRIKSRANDSELPGFEHDFQKREISFEWEGMFANFYHETAMLRKREDNIMTKSTQWLNGGEISIAGALALSKRNKEARRSCVKEIRRDRIKKWYLENHGWEFEDSLFEEEEENKALDAIEEFEIHSDFTRCAEDTQSRLEAESHAESQHMFQMMATIRQIKGIREDDEDALMAMFMEIARDPSADDNNEDDDVLEELDCDDDDTENDFYETDLT